MKDQIQVDAQIDDQSEDFREKTTVKTTAIVLPFKNELEYAKWKYDHALQVMLEDPTPEHIAAFEEANKFRFETEDKYRLGARIMLEVERVKALFSQKLHLL